MTMNLRPPQQTDVTSCVDIVLGWGQETPWLGTLVPRPELMEFWSSFLQEQEFVRIAEAEGRIVGFCTRNDDNIGALYVAGGMRNLGIGKRLLDVAKQNRDWITVWAYETNPHARRFYKREGLVEVGREVEEDSGLVDIEHRWFREASGT